MGQIETWKTQLDSIQSSLSNLNATDVGNDVGEDPEKLETVSDVPVNDDGKKSDTDKGTDKRTEKVNVFINGDAMPGRKVVPWLKTMHAENPDLKVYKAVGTGTGVDLAKRKLAESGIPETQITLVQAKTTSVNAADAVLTVLFGRHAEAGCLNIVLSDDKQWFGELPFMEISPGIRTIWLRFSELDHPRFPLSIEEELSTEEEQLCQMFLEYCRENKAMYERHWANCQEFEREGQIHKVYNGKKFREYVASRSEASWKEDYVDKAIAQVHSDLDAKSNRSPPPWVNLLPGWH